MARCCKNRYSEKVKDHAEGSPGLLATFIRERRVSKQMSQTELATAIGYRSPEAVALLETGRRRLDLDRVGELARALEVDPSVMAENALFEQHPLLFGYLMHHKPRPLGPYNQTPVKQPAPDVFEMYYALAEPIRDRIAELIREIFLSSKKQHR